MQVGKQNIEIGLWGKYLKKNTKTNIQLYCWKSNIQRYCRKSNQKHNIGTGYMEAGKQYIEIGRWEMQPHPASVAAANSADLRK